MKKLIFAALFVMGCGMIMSCTKGSVKASKSNDTCCVDTDSVAADSVSSDSVK